MFGRVVFVGMASHSCLSGRAWIAERAIPWHRRLGGEDTGETPVPRCMVHSASPPGPCRVCEFAW